MTKSQLVILCGSIFLFLGIYFGFDTKAPEQKKVEKVRTLTAESTDINTLLGSARNEISPEQSGEILLLEAGVNETSNQEDKVEAMKKDCEGRINNIVKFLGKLDPFEAERVVKLKERMLKNLGEYVGKDNIDANRFEQEIIYYLEKIDVTEEKVRLAQHCKYFLEEMNKSATQKGRKLNFISQEIGREINTLGSKAASSDIQHLVVQMKDELEKIKELVANSV